MDSCFQRNGKRDTSSAKVWLDSVAIFFDDDDRCLDTAVNLPAATVFEDFDLGAIRARGPLNVDMEVVNEEQTVEMIDFTSLNRQATENSQRGNPRGFDDHRFHKLDGSFL